MQISNILSKLTHEEKPQDVFLALEIAAEQVVASLWTVVDGKTKLIKTSPAKEWNEDGALLTAVDDCVTFLLTDFSRKIKGVIFGLEESWVEKEAIVSDRQPLLRQICQKLELKPLGFVVITEALIQYLKIVEGMPLSALLVKLEQDQATVTLVKLGKVVQSETVGRSDDLSADLKEALVRFGDIDSFPSRILLFDGLTDFEEARQQIISYDWPQELPFLHIPKVDILERNIAIKALAIAGGSEIAKSLGFTIKEGPADTAEPSEEQPVDDSQTNTIPAPVADEAAADEKTELPSENAASATEQSIHEQTVGDMESVGFVAEQDILWSKNVPESFPEEDTPENAPNPAPLAEKETEALPSKKEKGRWMPWRWPKLGFRWKKPSWSQSANWIFLPLALLVLIFGTGFGLYWYLPKAEVIVIFQPKTVEQAVTIRADQSADKIDLTQKILPVTTQTVEVSGTESRSVTGTTLAGDKAKGRVMIYNKTELPKTFASQTKLFFDDRIYALDEAVTIASQSAQQEGVVYGKQEAAVTAVRIGPEYNLKKDTELTVEDYARGSYSAVAISEIAGGTSREVTAVNEEDQAVLKNELKASLTEQAKTKISAAAGESTMLATDPETEIVSAQYDHQVGEQADTLRLDMAIKVKVLTARPEDLKTLVTHEIMSLVPEGYLIQGTESTGQEILTDDSQTTTLVITVKAVLLPQTDIEKIKEAVKGKYPSAVNSYLTTLPGFKESQIKITPKFLPNRLKTLPRRTERIAVIIRSS